MGQYYELYNLSKHERVTPYKIQNSRKLLEQIGWSRSTSTALFLLVTNSNGRGNGDAAPHPMIGRWAGDRILVQGDYAKPTDQGFMDEEKLSKFTDISDQVNEMLLVAIP